MACCHRDGLDLKLIESFGAGQVAARFKHKLVSLRRVRPSRCIRLLQTLSTGGAGCLVNGSDQQETVQKVLGESAV
jgi:hypothetical protein